MCVDRRMLCFHRSDCGGTPTVSPHPPLSAKTPGARKSASSTACAPAACPRPHQGTGHTLHSREQLHPLSQCPCFPPRRTSHQPLSLRKGQSDVAPHCALQHKMGSRTSEPNPRRALQQGTMTSLPEGSTGGSTLSALLPNDHTCCPQQPSRVAGNVPCSWPGTVSDLH